MTTLCSSVIIIIIHKYTNHYSNPFIIFITHILTKITIVYIIFTQHSINLSLYPNPILFTKYNTNIVQYHIVIQYTLTYTHGGCPCGVMVKAMDCRIIVSDFVLQLRYYVHFRANTLGKGVNPLILQLWVK